MIVFRKHYRTTILIVAAITLALLSPPAFASKLDAKRNELKSIKGKIEENRSRQNDAAKRQEETLREIKLNDEKITQLQTELSDLEKELNDTISKRKAVEANLKDTQERLDTTRKELTIAQEKLVERREVYNDRLVGVYKNGSSSMFLDVLLGSKSLPDVIERVTLIRIIAENDGKLINEIEQIMETISNKIREIEAHEKAIVKQRLQIIEEEKRVIEIRSKIVARQKLFEEELNRQKEKLARVKSEKSELEHAEDVLAATSNMIAEQIKTIERIELEKKKELERKRALEKKRELERKREAEASNKASNPAPSKPAPKPSSGSKPSSVGAKSSKGFIRPVSGRITSKFGMRFHPVLKYSRLHTGVDFGVPTGTPVYAVQSGTVVMAGWKGGYGYTVVINHGNGIATLYAHNSRIPVRAGQHVKQGQPIAYSGSTGLSTGPHLHFEVRVNGTPVDPLKWI